MNDHNDLLLRALYENLLHAWNNVSAENFAALFTKDATVIGFDGSLMSGQQQIQDELEKIFKDHKVGSYTGIVKGIKVLAPGLYLLQAVAGMVPAGQTELKEELNAMQTLIAKEEDGRFLIVHYQNTPAVFHGRKELSKTLTEELKAAQKKQRSYPRSL